MTIEQVEELRVALLESSELIRDITKWGECDCNIPNGETCITCQCAMQVKSNLELLKIQPTPCKRGDYDVVVKPAAPIPRNYPENKMNPKRFDKYRKDGWPLCPKCGEDELFSALCMVVTKDMKQPNLLDCLCAGFGCHKCGWSDD